MNSAELLLQFLSAQWNERAGVISDGLDAFIALADVETSVSAKQAFGEPNAAIYREALPRWRSGVADRVDGGLMVITGSGLASVAPGDLGLLGMLGRELKAESSPVSEETLVEVDTLLEQVLLALQNDDSLSQDLRSYIAKVVLHVRQCVVDARIGVDFQLREAVERLIGLIRFAEEKSAKPTVWSKVWENYGRPIGVALLIEAAKATIGFAAITGMVATPAIDVAPPPPGISQHSASDS